MLLVCVFILNNVLALDIGDVDNALDVNKDQGIVVVQNDVSDIWSSFLTVAQVLAIAAVIFSGLRYMFASADQKADIKRSMGILALGAILVFATTTVLKFVVKAGKDVISQ